jgi:hypothetical protein
MKADWQPSALQRPDRYLDWEYRTRRLKLTDSWCSVQVQVRPAGKKGYLPSLCRLLKAVEDGRQDDDGAGSDLTISMTDDEREHLKETIKRIKDGEDVKDKFKIKIEMQFFIYRLEPFIYYRGNYRNPAFYKMLFAGPVIKGLELNQPDGSAPIKFRPPLTTDAGRVAIGIVDDGIAFAHERFRSIPQISGPQTSRVHAIWLQETERGKIGDNGVLFGQRLTHEKINSLLQTCASDDEIYRQVSLTDFGRNEYNPLAARASHGTHILDLASGFPKGFPEDHRPIFAVQLPSVATIDTSGVTLGSYVLQGVRAITLWANQLGVDKEALPLVINFSYGLLAGPKDGTEYLEGALADLIHYRDRYIAHTRLVMPSGNSYRTRAAALMELKPSAHESVDWMVSPDDETANFIEIWLDGSAGKLSPVELTLTPPQERSGQAFRPVAGKMYALMAEGRPIAGIYYDVIVTGKKKRERIMLAVNPTVRNEDCRDLAPSGRWNVSIKNKMKHSITAHIYVQRDDTPFGYPRRGRQSRLDRKDAYARDDQTGDYREPAPGCPITHKETLSSIATCSPIPPDHTIVVGAAEASECYPPADYTASGPTILRKGPDCSAIADDGDAHRGVLAAGTLSGTVVAMNGTSVAAPQIVRQVADDLQAMGRSTSAGKPRASAASASGPVKLPVSNKARLGEFLLIPEENAQTLKRRYPANP